MNALTVLTDYQLSGDVKFVWDAHSSSKYQKENSKISKVKIKK